MKKSPILLLAGLIAGTGLVPVQPASAAPPRLEGKTCPFKVPPGTWVGYFDGYRESPFITREDSYWPVTRLRCFKTRADCIAWKYWIQTDFPAGTRTTWCRLK